MQDSQILESIITFPKNMFIKIPINISRTLEASQKETGTVTPYGQDKAKIISI